MLLMLVMLTVFTCFFFFFKQKTAYEMRISDWSSDVCSSDLFGKVTNLTDYGSFVEVEAGIEGLVHVSEMDWTNKNVDPRKVVTLGEEVEVMVLEIDEDRRRISLGMKQCRQNPWEERSEEHTSELQSLMRISYAVFCLKKKKQKTQNNNENNMKSANKERSK